MDRLVSALMSRKSAWEVVLGLLAPLGVPSPPRTGIKLRSVVSPVCVERSRRMGAFFGARKQF